MDLKLLESIIKAAEPNSQFICKKLTEFYQIIPSPEIQSLEKNGHLNSFLDKVIKEMEQVYPDLSKLKNRDGRHFVR